MRSYIRLGCENATCSVLPEDVHEKVIVIWNGQANTFMSKDVLAPQIFRIDNRWGNTLLVALTTRKLVWVDQHIIIRPRS